LWPGILAGVPCSEKRKWDWGLGTRKYAKKTTLKSEKS